MAGWTRRTFGKLTLAAIGAVCAPAAIGKARARVCVVGGGPAGTTAARHLAANFDGLHITLIEANSRYTTPFFCNRYLAGLRPLETFIHNYERVAAAERITVVHDRVRTIYTEHKTLRLAVGRDLPYDRLVIGPGVSFIDNLIEGYGAEAERALPHAYIGSMPEQWQILRRQLEAMENGGVVAISVPKRPYRCHPAPYERASLVANYLTRDKPRSKVLILDANNTFPLMDVMLEDWEERLGETIEWVSADFGGAVVAVDRAARTLTTVDDRIKADVANVIPPQQAGTLAVSAGLTDDSGWCPVDPLTFESQRITGIHVIGDAIEPGDMPRSAFAAHSQAKVCAVAIGNALTGESLSAPELSNRCYFLLRQAAGLIVGGRYRASNNRIEGIEGFASQAGEDSTVRKATSEAAERWYAEITTAMFG
jgi:NADPH-dependent 2,4-dienoyl-CoA reductase/sulfur reductase-like enzyme